MKLKFRFLLEKNYKSEIRQKRKIIFEIFVLIILHVAIAINPVVNTLNLELTEADLQKTKFSSKAMVENLTEFKKIFNLRSGILNYRIIATPRKPFFVDIISKLCNSFSFQQYKFYNSEYAMESNFDAITDLCAITFIDDEDSEKSEVVPHKLHLKIRFPSKFRTVKGTPVKNYLWTTRCSGVITADETIENYIDEAEQKNDLYLRETYLAIQHNIFLSFHESIKKEYYPTNKSISVGEVYARSFRHYTRQDVCNLNSSSNLLHLLYSFTFFFPFLNFIWKFAVERESNIFVHHWNYGISYTQHWLAHFIISYLHLILLNLVIMILAMIPWSQNPLSGVFILVNPGGGIVFLLTYNICLIFTAVLVACCFKNAKNCVYLGMFLWILCYSLFSVPLCYSKSISLMYVIISFTVFFNNTYGYAMNFLKNIEKADDFDMYYLMIPMFINILLTFIVIVVLQYSMPGRYMRPNQYDFMGLLGKCHKSKKKRKKKKRIRNITNPLTDAETDQSWRNFQSPPHNGVQYVQMRSVGTYNNQYSDCAVLENVTIDFFKGEISVIYGHHGAGKTTLLTILANWRHSDYGVVRFLGHDITNRNWHRYRKNVDILMPISHVFRLLTVKETIEYYINMKAGNTDELKFNIELNKWLKYMKPFLKKKSLIVSNLTYGEQHILALCCTLINDTKIILLDNPTGKLTTNDQVIFWKIIQAEKLERTIIMTTDSMDEAEAVGDRIAILEHGAVKAYGTIFFMRTNFHIGYNMIIQKKANFSSTIIVNMVDKHFPHAKLTIEQSNQLIFKLPANKRKMYQNLIMQLEINRRTLGIEHIEVIAGELTDVTSKLTVLKTNQNLKTEPPPVKFHFLSTKRHNRQIVKAMFYKKVLTQAPFVLPLAMVFISMISIIFISFIASGLKVELDSKQGLILGLPANESSESIFSSITSNDENKCTFYVIKELNIGDSTSKTNEKIRLFKNESFECGKTKFTKFILESKTAHDKFGAIEFVDADDDDDDDDQKYIVWINERILHSASLTLNFLHNYILQTDFQDPNFKISVDNQPMPTGKNIKINLLDNLLSHMPIALMIGAILPLTAAGFVMSIVEERLSDWWHLQKIGGMRYHVYWSVTLFWDSVTFIIYCAFYAIIISLIALRGFGIYEKFVLLILLIFYVPSALAQTYFFTLWSNDSVIRAFLKTALSHLITGLCSFVLYWDVFDNSAAMYAIFMFFPNFALLDGVTNVFAANSDHTGCESMCAEIVGCNQNHRCKYIPQCCSPSFFTFQDQGILLNIGALITSCLLIFGIIFIVVIYRGESRYAKRRDLSSLRSSCNKIDDRDVVKLRKQIAEADLRACKRKRYMVDQLENRIPRKKKIVNTLSFSAEKGQCVIFYGLRKSGKSRLMRKLVGIDGFSFGSIYTQGYEMKYDTKEVYKLIGYCPQYDGLIEVINVRQHLQIMCLLRGVPKMFFNYTIENLINALDMRKFINRRICTLAEYKRRKVNIALAFIGNTEIIFLDEPTFGLPQYVKQDIWKFFKWQLSLGKTIIMTTTDMSECEVMGNMVFVYHRNEILALGTAQKLRGKYTKGFYVDVQINRDGTVDEEIAENFQKDIDNLNRFISFMHSDSELIKRNDNVLSYYVPVERISYSYLYGAMEKNRSRLNVKDYTITQGSMRDVMTTLLNAYLEDA